VSIELEGARCNEEAARLLSWYMTGRLSPADVERVANHLQHCAICRDDMAHESAVRTRMKTDSRVEYAPQAGLAKTLSRIDELARDAPHEVSPPRVPAYRQRQRLGAVQWLTAAVLVQALALAWLGVSLRHPARAGAAPPRYETLSSDTQHAPVGPHIRAVFTPTMTLTDLHALLAANHLMIVRGPTDAGAYTLTSTNPLMSTAQLAPIAEILRNDARVLFAELAINDAPAAP
jgi:hypothetical protein